MEYQSIYTPDVITRLELGWGEGWLSPGGEDDVSELINGFDIAGTSVLDFGSGTGGPALLLASMFSARHVTGIDVEQSVIDRANMLAKSSNLENQVNFQRVSPGRLKFPDASFDIVFSKDVFVHIADKKLLFSELYRVLKPGGLCVFSDWCCGPPPYSEEMLQFFENGMNFTMATVEENCSHLKVAGFHDVSSKDRNEWYAKIAAQEYAASTGPRRAHIVKIIGREAADSVAFSAGRRALIAKQGHLRPAHFHASKPGC